MQLHTLTRQSEIRGFSEAFRGYSVGVYRGQYPEAAATLGKAQAAASWLSPSRSRPPDLHGVLAEIRLLSVAILSGQLHRVSLPGAAPHWQRWQSIEVISLLLIGRYHRGLNNNGKEYPLNHLLGLGRGR